jgi:hypothetical protein
MNDMQTQADRASQQGWLLTYYFTRALFSIAWVLAALILARHSQRLAAVLLVVYPAWDALANLADGARSGGLSNNRTQSINAVVSLAVAAAVAGAAGDMHRVLGVFGAWAILSGILQFGTAWRRRKTYGAQWAMILSGAQSALAGAIFIAQARMPAEPSITTIAGYAGFGAFYFLLSAVSLGARHLHAKRAPHNQK